MTWLKQLSLAEFSGEKARLKILSKLSENFFVIFSIIEYKRNWKKSGLFLKKENDFENQNCVIVDYV